jgi:methionine biosynthesis protein MetW
MKKHINIGYDLVLSLVPDGSRVLDLGCGDGILLQRLQKEKDVKGFGVEISESGVSKCVEKGLYCYQGDIDEGLSDYRDNSFDFVILNLTLQNTKKPRYVLREAMRIGKKAIISFPNFGYYKTRLNILVKGKVPQNELFPYEWYASPDIHMLSIDNFHEFCTANSYHTECQLHFSVRGESESRVVKVLPNLRAQYGFFILGDDPMKLNC